MLEDILAGSVAAATVAQPQDRWRLGITPLANAVPIPAKAGTGKRARVVRQAEVDRPTVAHPIVNARRNEHAVSPTGKSMIEGAKRLRAAPSTGPKTRPKTLLGFGVNRKRGMAGFLVCSDQTGDPPAMCITVRRVTASEVLRHLAPPQVLLRHPVPNPIGTNRRSPLGHSDGKSCRRPISSNDGAIAASASLHPPH